MAGFLTMIQALRNAKRDLDGLDKIAARVKPRPVGARAGAPEKFATYRDAGGRYELRYPKEWELDAGEGVMVRSRKILSFANVEVVPGTEAPWKELEQALTKLGGTLEITKRLAGPPMHMRGKLQLGPTRYAMNAWCWERAGELVVLSTANVIDAERSTKIERYEDKVLDAIRREFKPLAAKAGPA